MTKNIIIGVLIVALFFCLIYSFFQQTAANKAWRVAEQNLVLAVATRKEADVNAAMAQKEATAAKMAREEAEIARLDAETQRKIAEDCKKHK